MVNLYSANLQIGLAGLGKLRHVLLAVLGNRPVLILAAHDLAILVSAAIQILERLESLTNKTVGLVLEVFLIVTLNTDIADLERIVEGLNVEHERKSLAADKALEFVVLVY
jgi:hypothetical protein